MLLVLELAAIFIDSLRPFAPAAPPDILCSSPLLSITCQDRGEVVAVEGFEGRSSLIGMKVIIKSEYNDYVSGENHDGMCHRCSYMYLYMCVLCCLWTDLSPMEPLRLPMLRLST